MQIPENLIPFKPEVLASYIVAIVLSISDILDYTGKSVAIISTVVITYFLVKMYISQRKLNETRNEIEKQKLKMEVNKDE